MINKHSGAISILLALFLLLMPLAGCSDKQDEQGDPSESGGGETELTAFSYSDGIDENGFWEGIRALDHVELFDYRAMAVPRDIHTIAEEAVQSEIDSLLASFAVDQQILDRAVEDRDTVNIDYVGSVGGVEFQGGNTNGAGTEVTIGVTSYIDDFLEQLIGHEPGETFNVEVTFPEEYGVDELNGQDAVFVTTINYIVKTVEPSLNDEFVTDNLMDETGWSSVEEMRQGITADLQKAAILSYAQEYLKDNANITSMPPELVGYMENSLVNYYQEGASYYGVEIEEILGMYEGVSTVEELLALYYDDNVEQAGYYLIVQAVAEDAQITVSDADVTAYFTDLVGTGDYSQFEEQFGMPYLKQGVLNQLVLDYLVEHAVLEA